MKEIKTIVREFDKNNNLVYIKDDTKEVEKRFDENNNMIFYKYKNSLFEEIRNIEYNGDIIKKDTTITSKQNNVYKHSITIYYKSKHSILTKYSNGLESKAYYDDNENLIHEESNDGYKCDYKYDDNNNQIYYKSVETIEEGDYVEAFMEYDDHNNQTSFKLYKDGEVVDDNIHEFEYLENGDINIHSIYKYENLESWKTVNAKGNILHYKDSNNEECWNIIDGNKTTNKNNEGYENVSVFNDNGDIISFSDNRGKEIEYVYEDKYLN